MFSELPTTAPPSSYKCEGDDMILYNDKCFKQGAGKDSWSDAHLGCLQVRSSTKLRNPHTSAKTKSGISPSYGSHRLPRYHSQANSMYNCDTIFGSVSLGHTHVQCISISDRSNASVLFAVSTEFHKYWICLLSFIYYYICNSLYIFHIYIMHVC